MRHRLEHAALRLGRASLSAFPERLALALGAGMGLVLGDALRVRRRDVDRHLAWAFPERPSRWRRKVARGCYRHLGREAVVMFGSGSWPKERVLERTRVVGFEPFRQAALSGTGVVLLTGHLGNWEMGGAAIAARDVPLDVVGKGMSNRRFQSDLFRARERLGMRVIEMGDAPREALRSLAEGKVVALLGDQSAHGGTMLLPFFGRPALTARGPAVFAMRSGAPVFVAFALRDRGRPQRYTVTFEPLELSCSGDLEKDVRSLMTAYGSALESAIRCAPEQYFWHHRRWKGAPAPEPV